MRFIACCLCVCIMLGSVAAVALSMFIVKETEGDSELLDLDNIELSYTTILYNKQYNEQGQPEWVEYTRLQSGEENRIWRSLDQISDHIEHAFIAVEDKEFYTHPGFNLKRTIFAAMNEVARALTGSYLASSQQGASTIEQQLIKNITNEDESSGIAGYTRKIKEIFRAISLDNRYSKDIILEAYLNTIGLTGNTAGVEAGANKYFGKSAADVTVAEAASIAAITKNPTQYSPYQNPEQHLKRRDDIIYFMLQQGYISEAEAQEAWDTPLRLIETAPTDGAAVQTTNSWFTDVVVAEVLDDLEAENPLNRESWTRDDCIDLLYNGGLRIYITVDTDVQTAVEDVWQRGEYWNPFTIEDYVPEGAPEGTAPKAISTQAACAVINYSGELVGVAGALGPKTADRVYNRATEMERQVGSTMKGVAAYPLGIDGDWINWSTMLPDAYFQDGTIKNSDGSLRNDWPRNWDGAPSGEQKTVYEAVKKSLNTVAVYTGSMVTARTMFDFARDTLGISTLDENKDVSLAPMVLGATTTGMSPYQLAGAYMMYGDEGRVTNLHSYTLVTDYQGNTILEKDIYTTQAIGEDTAFIMNRLLHGVLFDSGGTAVGVHPSTDLVDSVGKTGTTNEDKDVWFVGLTPQYVMATWYGYDENEPMEDYTSYYIRGGHKHPGASAFAEVMNTVSEKKLAEATALGQEFATGWEMPDTVEKGAYCAITGDIPTEACPRGTTGYYKKDGTRQVCLGVHDVAPAA